MITPTKRFIIVADQQLHSDHEVINFAGVDVNDAHVVARRNSLGEPGRRFFICEVVGFHEAAVRPPSFTSFGDPQMKVLPRLVETPEAPAIDWMATGASICRPVGS